MASMVTNTPCRSSNSKSFGMAVISLDLASVITWPRIRCCSVAQALTGATVVTTIAGHLRDALVGVRPELATRVVAIGNAVDARPTTEPPPLPVVAFVGRLEHQKGLDVLLRALPSVLARHPELRTVVMGGGSQGAELRALSKRLGVDHAVTFVGHQPPEAVAALLDQCLVVAMPSRYEGLPYVAVEAAAAGRAVVGSRIPGLDEAVVDGTTGILVDPGEPAALAEAVAALAGNPEWCAAMGEAGHARLQLDADVGDAAAALQLVYRRAVERDEIPGLVSVIVPVRNGAAFIAEALASVRAQEGGLPTEVVVVDDGSTDDTAAVVARCDPAATVIRHCRGGPGPARNAGLALTTGEYVALLDADDRWPPGRLARLMGVLAAHADLEAVFGSAVEFGGSHDTVARPGVLPARMPTSGIIRRRAFDRVGGFRVGLIGGDAVDWMVRFLAIGQPIRVVDDVVLERRVHGRNTGRGRAVQRERLAALKRDLDRRRQV